MLKNKKHYLTLFLMIVLFTSCATSTPTVDSFDKKPSTTSTIDALDKQLLDTVAKNKKMWEELNIENYKYELNESSVWSNFTLTITVRNGKVVEVYSHCDDALLDQDGDYCNSLFSEIYPQNYTVDNLFYRINYLYHKHLSYQNEYESISDVNWYETINTRFDNQYHIPTLISLDHPDWADEEFTITVSNFVIINE